MTTRVPAYYIQFKDLDIVDCYVSEYVGDEISAKELTKYGYVVTVFSNEYHKPSGIMYVIPEIVIEFSGSNRGSLSGHFYNVALKARREIMLDRLV